MTRAKGRHSWGRWALGLGLSAITLTGCSFGHPGAVGPRGAQGPRGPRGPMGPPGPRGATGPQGPRGATGPQGPQGARGATGPQGLTGPTGPAGSAWLSGATLPPASAGGVGDYWFDTATATLYGPKTTAGWPTSGMVLRGPTGPQGLMGATGATGAPGPTGPGLLSGSTAPTATQPANAEAGDFYLDTTTETLYGPAVATPSGLTWGSGVSLVGPGSVVTGPLSDPPRLTQAGVYFVQVTGTLPNLPNTAPTPGYCEIYSQLGLKLYPESVQFWVDPRDVPIELATFEGYVNISEVPAALGVFCARVDTLAPVALANQQWYVVAATP
jgi:hypothetical protein